MAEHQGIAAILRFSVHDLLVDHSSTRSTTKLSATSTFSSETSTDPLLGVNNKDSDIIDDAILRITNDHILELERETAAAIETLLAYARAGYTLARTKEGDRKFRILQLKETCDQLRRWRVEMEVNRSSLALQMRRDSKDNSEEPEEGGVEGQVAEKCSTARRTTMRRLRALCSIRGRAKSNSVKGERDAIPKMWVEADRAGSQTEHTKLSQVKSQEYDADVSAASTQDSASERGETEMLAIEAKGSEKDTAENAATTAEKIVRKNSPDILRQEGEGSATTPVPRKRGLRTWTDAAGYMVFDWSGSTDDEACSPRSRNIPVENAVTKDFERKDHAAALSAPTDGSTTDSTTLGFFPEEIPDPHAGPPHEIRQPSHTDNWPLVTSSQLPTVRRHLPEEPKQHAARPFRNMDTDSGDQ